MKTYIIDINSGLKNVEITVKNGKKFENAIIKGEYKVFNIVIADKDIGRVKKYAVKYANDKSSNKGRWYAHCNGYSMDLFINYNNLASINTYRHYGKEY